MALAPGDRCVKPFVVMLTLAAVCNATGIAAAQDASLAAPKRTAAKNQSRSKQAAPVIAIPEQFAPPQEEYASFPRAAAAAAAVAHGPTDCEMRLEKVAVFEPLHTLAGPGECGAADAVQLQSVIMPDKTKIAVAPPATLRCAMAEGVARWVREDVGPAALKLGSPLRSLDDFDSYECRGRNRVKGAMLSEHGRANALDVRGFKLADGKNIELTDVNIAKDWREQLRQSACARFTTVLGPGSDGYHEEHIHLDLAERRNGYRLCEWDVREPVVQTAKNEVKTTATKPVEIEKSDAPKTGAAKTEAARTEAARTEAARTEAARTEAARTEAARTEAIVEQKSAAIVGPVPLPRPRPFIRTKETRRRHF
jgi:hypothetical protein